MTPPALACDAHCHVLDAPGMRLADYAAMQRRLGTRRAVFVQAKFHRTDNDVLLAAIARQNGNGSGNARGIAVLHPDATDAGLARLQAGGVRGLRFSLWNPADTVTTIDMIAPLAARIAALGWHAQLHLSAAQIVQHAALIGGLACPVVFDHMGRLPPALGPDHPAFAVIRDLLDRGRAWVKLSGAYLNTEIGPPDYPDAGRIARAFVALAPQRLVWGSDWPHLTETHKPDDAGLLGLLAQWAGSEALAARILVDNPAALYGFATGGS